MDAHGGSLPHTRGLTACQNRLTIILIDCDAHGWRSLINLVVKTVACTLIVASKCRKRIFLKAIFQRHHYG